MKSDPFTPEQRRMATELIAKGRSDEEIARAVGVSPLAVFNLRQQILVRAM